LCTAPARRRQGLQQTPKVLHITFLRQVNPLIPKLYEELIKDSPRPGEAHICALCTALRGGRPQAYPQVLWISGKCFAKQGSALNC
jgi:hypothetical protein